MHCAQDAYIFLVQGANEVKKWSVIMFLPFHRKGSIRCQYNTSQYCLLTADLGGIPGSRFSENSELFNPENRQTQRFPFQKER